MVRMIDDLNDLPMIFFFTPLNCGLRFASSILMVLVIRVVVCVAGFACGGLGLALRSKTWPREVRVTYWTWAF